MVHYPILRGLVDLTPGGGLVHHTLKPTLARPSGLTIEDFDASVLRRKGPHVPHPEGPVHGVGEQMAPVR